MDLRIDEKGKYYTQRVIKDSMAAFVRTAEQIIVGHIYVRPDYRLKDEFDSDHSRFLPITDADVYDAGTEQLLYRSSFLLVAYHHITMISPLEALTDIRTAPWQPHAQEELA